jgi:hypothetical protein
VQPEESRKKRATGIIRVEKTRDFSIIRNDTVRDARLSFGARGVLTYLLTKPDDWEVRSQDLVQQSPHGEDAILRMLKELETCGYLSRWRERNKHGRYEWRTVVYENPADNPNFKPNRDFPGGVSPGGENPGAKEELSHEKQESGQWKQFQSERPHTEEEWKLERRVRRGKAKKEQP